MPFKTFKPFSGHRSPISTFRSEDHTNSLQETFLGDLKISINQIQYSTIQSPGQAPVLHSLDSTDFPLQSVPPLEGGGSLQLLVLDVEPPPQVIVHSLQTVHDPHAPFTGTEND